MPTYRDTEASELRAALHAGQVPHDTALAEAMIRRAVGASGAPAHTRWTGPLLASAAVVAVAGGVAAAGALGSGGGAGGGTVPQRPGGSTTPASTPHPNPPLSPGMTLTVCTEPPGAPVPHACDWVVLPGPDGNWTFSVPRPG